MLQATYQLLRCVTHVETNMFHGMQEIQDATPVEFEVQAVTVKSFATTLVALRQFNPFHLLADEEGSDDSSRSVHAPLKESWGIHEPGK